MEASTHELDPKGDVELIVQRPNLQELVWPDHADKEKGRERKEEKEENQVKELNISKKGKKKRRIASRSLEFSAPNVVPAPGAESDSINVPYHYGPLEPNEPRIDELSVDEALHNFESTSAERPDDRPAQWVSEYPGGRTTPDADTRGKLSCQNDELPDEVRLRVSSRHLCLASPIFRRQLEGPWKESIPNNESLYKIETSDWDIAALLILMNIIHGHHRDVPRSIDLETLAKIAILVDYYQCHEVTEIFAVIWMTNLEQNMPCSYGKESVILTFVSWVFSNAGIFQKMTALAIKESEGALETMLFPLPNAILTAIETERTKAIQQIFDALHLLRDSFYKDSCSFECSAMLLGSLLKQLRSSGLGNLELTAPFYGHSVVRLGMTVSEFREPRWRSTPSCGWSYNSCSLTDKIKAIVKQTLEALNGVKLEDCLSSERGENLSRNDLVTDGP
jgi:hypothetical protein